ncbi:MAG: protein translocase subunit SecD [Sporichthyaceae bacterium]
MSTAPGSSRAPAVRAAISLLILVGSLYAAFTIDAKLGLDLRGGTQVVLETKDSPQVTANRESTERAVEVLRRRVDALGVAEPSLTRAGDRRIIVELPGLQEPREAAEVLGRTAQLTFHEILGEDAPGQTGPTAPAPAGALVLSDEDGIAQLQLAQPALTGAGVRNAQATFDVTRGGWYVDVDFNGSGEGLWEGMTGKAACEPVGAPSRRIAIVLDGQVISSPQVDPSVACERGIAGGTTTISGSFTEDGAKDLAVLISGGALPVPVEIIEQRTVGPTLGQAAIDASKQAAIIGIILTGLFIMVVYRLMGALATLALACYALISYAALLILGATLTLPGLAGFVLAIGIAIDANVLIFERAREEFAAGTLPGTRKNLRGSLEMGFAKAWTAIIDSNVTTLLAAGLLFYFASGPVKGFGVTLSIGVIASMISALIIARSLTELAARRPWLRRRPALTGIAAPGRVRTWLVRRDPDLMRRRTLWLSISGLLLVVAATGIIVRGLNLGVEFTGGRLMEYSTAQTLDAEVAREKLSAAGFPRAIVQSSGDDDITVRAAEVSNDDELRIREALAEVGGEVTKLRDELIGPSLGKELRQNAIIAFLIALAAQTIYLAVRFRWTFGAAAVLAMFHDVVLVTGAFAWMGRPIDGVFLAAVLTIVGLSVNDSVVVFDRVREMWAANPTMPFARICNAATLQTVPRTINTGLGAMFILGALALLGGDSLVDFALALLLGLIIGTASSVFTATPLAIVLQARSAAPPPQPRQLDRATRGKQQRDVGDSGAVV